MKISVAILSRNEEKNIIRCLESLSFCNEIILIDDYSSDKTAEIAKSRGVAVFKRKLNGDFARQRNFAFKKATNDWVLFLDADEVISPTLFSEIVRRVKEGEEKGIVGYYFSRKDFFINSFLKYGETSRVKLLRLAKKSAGLWEGKVHEEWKVTGKTELMKNPILHYSHNNLADSFAKINFYSDLRAQELFLQGKRGSLLEIIIYPMAKFIKNYFWYLGFLDKTGGLVFALMMSFHSFLVRGKLWQLRKKNKEKIIFNLFTIWVLYILGRYLWLLFHWR